MRTDKKTKMILNGILVAAVAAFGISAYQLTGWEEQEPIQQVIPQEKTQNEEKKQEPAKSAGTSKVKAELKSKQKNTVSGTKPGQKNTSKKTEDSTEQEASTASTGNVISAAEVEAAYRPPVIDFSEDSLMEWPVNGNILIDYNMDNTTYFPTLDQYKLSPAIAVGAYEGAPVVSAVNGTVFTIEQDPQTGTTLTMNLGNGYQAVYGQLTDLTVEEGEDVTKGTTIGYVAQPTRYYDKEGANLYFAMKKDGQPIDPITYLP